MGWNARGVGEGKRKKNEKIVLPRWGGGGGGDAGKKRRLWRRKTAGIGEGKLPAASATSPRLLATARSSGALPLPALARWPPSPPPPSVAPALPLFFLSSVSLLSLYLFF